MHACAPRGDCGRTGASTPPNLASNSQIVGRNGIPFRESVLNQRSRSHLLTNPKWAATRSLPMIHEEGVQHVIR